MKKNKERTAIRNVKLEKHMVGRARSLRQTSTLSERMLWNGLRNATLSKLKFRRQHPIGPYVADFCCCQRKLVVELDGDSHDFTEEQDAKRTKFLENQGYRVIRFSDDDVMNHFEAVLVTIERELNI